MINPTAAFDCLSIARRLQSSLKNSAPGEIHLFAYLSCLLSLYGGQAASSWGYSFAGTQHGSPFSPELNGALEDLLALGLLSSEGQYLMVAQEGTEEYGELRRLSQNLMREKYIEAACSSLLSLPVGLIRSALSEEPMLRPSTKLGSTRALLRSWFGTPSSAVSRPSNAVGVDTRDLLVLSDCLAYFSFTRRGRESDFLGSMADLQAMAAIAQQLYVPVVVRAHGDTGGDVLCLS